jgi:hypothetical protein
MCLMFDNLSCSFTSISFLAKYVSKRMEETTSKVHTGKTLTVLDYMSNTTGV